jgi:hypothetical protein
MQSSSRLSCVVSASPAAFHALTPGWPWQFSEWAFFQPLLTAECQGQDSVLSLLLFTVCFVNLVRGQAWIAGSALAFTTYKPQLALAMIAILAITSEKRWRILAGFIETCLGLAALSIAMLGWRACAAYPAFVGRFAADFDDVKSRTETMPNLRGLMYPIFGTHLSHPVFVLLVGAVSVLFVLAAIWALWRKGGTVQGNSSPICVGGHGHRDCRLPWIPPRYDRAAAALVSGLEFVG